jgi:broad specificity phosphatase PhoE
MAQSAWMCSCLLNKLEACTSPHLTPLGLEQAQAMQAHLAKQMKRGMPFPGKSSPTVPWS